MIGYPPPLGGRTVRGESLGGPGSIPGMECLRSITPLAHLTLPKWQQNRIRDLRWKFARTRGQSRSSTAIEHPKKFGKRGFDSHRARQFRRAAEFGLSVKRETASAFKPRTIGQPMDSQLALCPSFSFFGWADVLRLSNWVAQLRQSIS